MNRKVLTLRFSFLFLLSVSLFITLLMPAVLPPLKAQTFIENSSLIHSLFSLNLKQVLSDDNSNNNLTEEEKEKEKKKKKEEKIIFDLGEVVVTATKTPKTMHEVSTTTEVISEEEIQQTGSDNLGEVLENTGGLFLFDDYMGFTSGIQLQGLDPKYTLILIDGDRVIGRQNDVLDLNSIPLENIDHIEIVKGPLSSLYGSEAMGGVVNIITKEPSEGISGRLEGQYGSYDTYFGNAFVSGKVKSLGYTLSAGYKSSDGFDMDKSTDLMDADAYDKRDYSGKLDYQFLEAHSLGFTWRFHDEDRFGIEQMFGPTSERNVTDKRRDFVVKYEWKPTDLLSGLTLKGYQSDYEHELLRTFWGDILPSSLDKTEESNQEVNLDAYHYFGKDHNLSFGGGYRLEDMESDRISLGEEDVDTAQWYLQDDLTFCNTYQIISGIRGDYHSTFGDFYSPKLSFLVRPTESFSMRASAGLGFKSPTIKELYMDMYGGFYQVYGNPDLDPEESAGYDLTFDYLFGDLYGMKPRTFQIKVNFYRNNIKDLIDFVYTGDDAQGTPIYSYRNVTDAVTQGIDTDFKWNICPFSNLDLSYQFLDAYDKETEEDLPLRPENTAHGTLNAFYPPFGTNSSLKARFVDKMNYGGDDISPAYWQFDFYMAQKLNNIIEMENIKIEVFTGIDNIFDKKNIQYGPRPGREYYGGMRLDF